MDNKQQAKILWSHKYDQEELTSMVFVPPVKDQLKQIGRLLALGDTLIIRGDFGSGKTMVTRMIKNSCSFSARGFQLSGLETLIKNVKKLNNKIVIVEDMGGEPVAVQQTIQREIVSAGLNLVLTETTLKPIYRIKCENDFHYHTIDLTPKVKAHFDKYTSLVKHHIICILELEKMYIPPELIQGLVDEHKYNVRSIINDAQTMAVDMTTRLKPDETDYHKPNIAELERLALLAGECAEVIHMVNKIIRHGFESYNPNSKDKITNRENLIKEISHVNVAASLMTQENDFDVVDLNKEYFKKRSNINQWLVHNKIK